MDVTFAILRESFILNIMSWELSTFVYTSSKIHVGKLFKCDDLVNERPDLTFHCLRVHTMIKEEISK